MLNATVSSIVAKRLLSKPAVKKRKDLWRERKKKHKGMEKQELKKTESDLKQTTNYTYYLSKFPKNKKKAKLLICNDGFSF